MDWNMALSLEEISKHYFLEREKTKKNESIDWIEKEKQNGYTCMHRPIISSNEINK